MSRNSQPRVNAQIRSSQVRVIDSDGSQLGVRSLSDALNLAQERGYDLLEVSPNSSPPVCRILDFSKYRYEREKKIKEQRKHQKAGQLKEVRLGLKISQHDFDIKMNRVEKFLKSRDKVRVTIFFRGREMEHKERGVDMLDRIKIRMERLAAMENRPQMTGNRLVTILAPSKQ